MTRKPNCCFTLLNSNKVTVAYHIYSLPTAAVAMLPAVQFTFHSLMLHIPFSLVHFQQFVYRFFFFSSFLVHFPLESIGEEYQKKKQME